MIIVGGGLNGATMALSSAQSGLTSLVLDSLPADRQRAGDFDGRGYALALSSQRLLQRLGVWQALSGTTQPLHEIKVSDGRVGDASVFLGLHFDSAELEEGPMGYMCEDRFLRRALLDALEENPLITTRNNARVVSQEITASGVSVLLDGGARLHGRLLVGADGRRSGTAQRAGIKRMEWAYDQTALVCAIAHDKPHDGVAHQLFLPQGPLAILPLPGNRSSIVWERKHRPSQNNPKPVGSRLS